MGRKLIHVDLTPTPSRAYSLYMSIFDSYSKSAENCRSVVLNLPACAKILGICTSGIGRLFSRSCLPVIVETTGAGGDRGALSVPRAATSYTSTSRTFGRAALSIQVSPRYMLYRALWASRSKPGLKQQRGLKGEASHCTRSRIPFGSGCFGL